DARHHMMTVLDHPRVLLVDDNETILERAAAALSSACVIVGAVKDGIAALESTATLQPDVVVLDISMPGMTGFEVARFLLRAGSTVPIVFLTVHDEEGFVEAAQAVGGIGFVIKSLLATDLAVAISEACAGRQYVSRLG